MFPPSRIAFSRYTAAREILVNHNTIHCILSLTFGSARIIEVYSNLRGIGVFREPMTGFKNVVNEDDVTAFMAYQQTHAGHARWSCFLDREHVVLDMHKCSRGVRGEPKHPKSNAERHNLCRRCQR